MPNMIESISDQELILRIVNMNSEALKQLYDRYERPLYAFAYRMVQDVMLAEEVVQELFLRIWNEAQCYEAGQVKLASWMFMLTRNIAKDYIRKHIRTPKASAPPEQLEFVADFMTETLQQSESKLIGELVRESLIGLNSDQRQAVELIYYEGLTQQEVSDRCDIPLGTVKSRVRLALHQLKRKLAVAGKDEFGT